MPEWTHERKDARVTVRMTGDVIGGEGKDWLAILREEIRPEARFIGSVVKQAVEGADYTGVEISYQVSVRHNVVLTFTIRGPFFYQEWDAKPHMPPWGKGSKLETWATDHGLSHSQLYHLAHQMARGRAIGQNNREVATKGKYAFTKAMEQELVQFSVQMDAALERTWDRWAGQTGVL